MHAFLSLCRLFAALLFAGGVLAGELPAPAGSAHVALLLPLNSGAFGRAADAVKQGFTAAAAIQAGALPVKIYPSGDQADDIVSAYGQATQAGARIVVGPLTRNGVSALAARAQVSVPTLALNQPEGDLELPPLLYVFGLSAESEARQLAQMAYAEGHRTVTVIASGSALAKRVQSAFVNEWPLLGGEVVNQVGFTGTNSAAVREALQKRSADMLFLAMDGQDARLLRPYLNPAVPAYATSLIYAGKNHPQKYHDLKSIRFMDMPWLLQPDHLAVMVYPRPSVPVSADLERLYALGIDAWRLALALQGESADGALELDGVTGRLSLEPSRQFARVGVRAEFRDGDAVPLTP